MLRSESFLDVPQKATTLCSIPYTMTLPSKAQINPSQPLELDLNPRAGNLQYLPSPQLQFKGH